MEILWYFHKFFKIISVSQQVGPSVWHGPSGLLLLYNKEVMMYKFIIGHDCTVTPCWFHVLNCNVWSVEARCCIVRPPTNSPAMSRAGGRSSPSEVLNEVSATRWTGTPTLSSRRPTPLFPTVLSLVHG